jgi:hypothetical protein
MTVTVTNIAGRDQLPGQKDYKRLLAAVAVATTSEQDHDAGMVLDAAENTSWKSKGMGESVTITLADKSKIKRIDVEWDPDLARTGYAKILLSDTDGEDKIPTYSLWATVDQDTSMFSMIEDPGRGGGINAKHIRIKCFGNKDNDLNGITNIAVYGYELK